MDWLRSALEGAVEASGQVLELHPGPVRVRVATDHTHKSDSIRAHGAQADASDDVLAGSRGEAVEISGDGQDRLIHCSLRAQLRTLWRPGDRVVHGVAEAFHDGVDVRGRCDIGWGDADVVAVLAIHGAVHRSRKAVCEGSV